ncbi:MAG: V-type ATP synthase subunit I [Lachnospiraceae bacterium]|nr:V-type ATP synthase subunit I [Lachnospiraceae bacterium]
MAVLQMQRISICAVKEDRKAILEQLQKLGVLEINLDMKDSEYERLDTAGAKNAFQKRMHLADQALEVLGNYAPEKSSLFSGLAGKPVLQNDIYTEAAPVRSRYSKIANELVSMDKEIAVQKAAIVKLENRIEELEPWMKLDVAMNFEGTHTSTFFVGTLPFLAEEAKLLSMIAEKAPDLEAFTIDVLSIGRDQTYLAVIVLRTEAAELEEVLRNMGFARPSHLINKPPLQKKEELKERIHTAEEKIRELEQKITAMAEHREALRLVSDYYRVRTDKYDVLGKLPETQRTFAIGGYVPKRYASELADRISSSYDAIVELEDIKEEEDAPVLLQNNRFAASGEGILASFGLPHKGELDPTFIMTIFYVFLFGLMLSDAAYGAIVSIACAIAILKFPRMGESLKKSLQLFFWCGLSTLFWGLMFGGFFGDAVDIIAKTFFGVQLESGQSLIPALWFVPLNDPMRMLMYSMLFGCIHLFTGLGIKGYLCLRDRDYAAFFFDVVCWFLMLLGLIFILLPTDLFASISQMHFNFPPVVGIISKAAAAAGALGILLFSGRRKKNWGLRIALGAYDLYNITGWLSDVLSYSRLLALGLATGVIASVVNQMGSMVGKSFFGVVVFILVFIVGHLFNLAINLLGAYVHTCRLQYVEFFGKFYEGGGKEFTPFAADTKYVNYGGK